MNAMRLAPGRMERLMERMKDEGGRMK